MPFSDQLFLASQYLAPQHLVSRLYGLAAECRIPRVKNWMIKAFIHHYGVDMSEAVFKNPDAYETFNDFFTRKLKSGARILAKDPHAIVCPVDGTVSQLGRIARDRIFQAKGHTYNVTELLGGDPERAQPFMNGDFATVYLAPRDYHRVHMPLSGVLREMIYVPGRLFSVNPLTTRHVPNLFARNERAVCLFHTECGPMAVILVGAMIVASIETVWAGPLARPTREIRQVRYHENTPIRLERGAELGRFKLGSTVIMLFGPHRIRWPNPALRGDTVKMGQALAHPK